MIVEQAFEQVVLLEDDDNDRILIERSLRRCASNILHFSSVAKACRYLASHDVDVILCDLKVDDSQGIETFRKIQHFAKESAIIVLSGFSRDEVAIQAVKEGAQDFMLKDDINSSSLELKIRLALERSSLRQQLLVAEKKASEQSHFKSAFLADFSHEIRTPLNAVIGAATLLEGTDLDAEQEDLVETLIRGGDRLLSIVSDILDISKIESGKFDLDYSFFEVRELVGDILSIFTSQIHGKRLYFIDYIDPEVPAQIESDSKRIKQILLNFVSNALKFTNHGFISISVKMNEAGLIEFSVRDTGRGIRKEELKELFQPFSQIEKKDASHGTGLGLAVCHKLAHLLGGDIGATPCENGEGSLFWFTVKPKQVRHVQQPRQHISDQPIYVMSQKQEFHDLVGQQLLSRHLNVHPTQSMSELSDALAGDKTESVVVFDDVFLSDHEKSQYIQQMKAVSPQITTIVFSQQSMQQPCLVRGSLHHSHLIQSIAKVLVKDPAELENLGFGHKEKRSISTELMQSLYCLVVDDDFVNRKIMEKTLTNLKVKSDLAENGLLALERLEQGHLFDVVFMDCTMPEINGYEASKILRERDDKVVIVALTAHAFEEDKQKCLASGMDLFLSKPIRLNEVTEALKKAFEIKKSRS